MSPTLAAPATSVANTSGTTTMRTRLMNNCPRGLNHCGSMFQYWADAPAMMPKTMPIPVRMKFSRYT